MSIPGIFSELGDHDGSLGESGLQSWGLAWVGAVAGCAAGGFGEGGDAQVDCAVTAVGDLIHLGEFVAGSGEADFQALGFEEPGILRTGDFGLLRGALFLKPLPLNFVGRSISQR